MKDSSIDKTLFKPYYITNFPVKLRTTLEHKAIDKNIKLSKLIIRILEKHTKEDEFKPYGENAHHPSVWAK